MRCTVLSHMIFDITLFQICDWNCAEDLSWVHFEISIRLSLYSHTDLVLLAYISDIKRALLLDNQALNNSLVFFPWYGIQGRIQGGMHPERTPPKIGKNMIFWHKIMIFHTKYPNNFRASLRSAQFF